MGPLSALRGHTDKSLEAAQARYKKHFDSAVGFTPTINPVQQVFVDRATKATHSPAERIAEDPRRKLPAPSTGRFPVQSTTTDAATYGIMEWRTQYPLTG